jgi:TusA-related sulfurtransferase
MRALNAEIKADKVVDARFCCTYALLDIRIGMLEVPIGGVLEIHSNEACCKDEVQVWARHTGNEFLGVVTDPRYDRIFVRRLK